MDTLILPRQASPTNTEKGGESESNGNTEHPRISATQINNKENKKIRKIQNPKKGENPNLVTPSTEKGIFGFLKSGFSCISAQIFSILSKIWGFSKKIFRGD